MKTLLLTVVTALALFTVHALAASPSGGGWQAKLNSDDVYGEGEGVWKITTGGAMKAGRNFQYILAPSNFKCNSANLALVDKKIPVEGGEFVYKGKAYVDYFRAPKHKGDLTWKGTYTSAGKVKGTIRFDSPVTPKPDATAPQGIKFKKKECDTGKVKWGGRPDPNG
jgi:hypothetical protein